MHILVVEDDIELARRIASALTEAGHDPIVVHAGEKALDKTKATPFDLIVLDIILPGIVERYGERFRESDFQRACRFQT